MEVSILSAFTIAGKAALLSAEMSHLRVMGSARYFFEIAYSTNCLNLSMHTDFANLKFGNCTGLKRKRLMALSQQKEIGCHHHDDLTCNFTLATYPKGTSDFSGT